MDIVLLSAEDLAREEVGSWEAELPASRRSRLEGRDVLLARIFHWRIGALESRNQERLDRCNKLLASLSVG